MDISISYSTREDFIRYKKLRWKPVFRTYYRFSLYLIVFGKAFLIWGATEPFSLTVTLPSKANTTITNYDFHISVGLGAGFMLAGLFHLFLLEKTKLAVMRMINIQVKKATITKSWEITLHVTPAFIEYRDFEELTRTHWSRFYFYKLVNNSAYVFYDKKNASHVVIELQKLSSTQQRTVLGFLRSNLKSL